KPQTIAITQQPTPNKTTKVKAKTCPAASGLFSDSGAMNELTPAERMINTPIAKPKNERAANTIPSTLMFFLNLGAFEGLIVPAVLHALQSNHISTSFLSDTELLRKFMRYNTHIFLAERK